MMFSLCGCNAKGFDSAGEGRITNLMESLVARTRAGAASGGQRGGTEGREREREFTAFIESGG